MTHDKIRCFGTGNPLYEAYHDEEWGRPIPDSPDERELFERLSLEAFMVGLSWLTVLRKREAFRRCFHDFAPATVAALTQADVERLMGNAEIIRNRTKIVATITNAQALIRLHADGTRLIDLFTEYAPEPRTERHAGLHTVPSQTEETRSLAKKLKTLGFTFVGPVTLYSTLQAIGVVDDHVSDCWVSQHSGTQTAGPAHEAGRAP